MTAVLLRSKKAAEATQRGRHHVKTEVATAVMRLQSQGMPRVASNH